MTNFQWLADLKQRLVGAQQCRRRQTHRRLSQLPHIGRQSESLEDRALLATITVTSLADNMTASDGFVTLREAIEAAETDVSIDGSTAGSGADEIIFAPSLFYGGPQTLSLSTFTSGTEPGEVGRSAFMIATSITIRGPLGEQGLTLQSDNTGRHFQILAGASLGLENLTLSGGRASGADGGGSGLGGSIHNEGTLSVVRSLFTDNIAQGGNGNGDGYGGAIFSQSAITQIDGATFTSNSVLRGAGENVGIGIGGGAALYVRGGSLQLSHSTVSGNFADSAAVAVLADDGVTTSYVLLNNIIANTNAPQADPQDPLVPVEDLVLTTSGSGILTATAPTTGLIIESGSSSSVPINESVADKIIIADPLLGELQFNGGPTKTLALLPGSPALDAGDVDATVTLGTTADGRGFESRIVGDAVDLGAVEFGATPTYVAPLGSATVIDGIGNSGLGDFEFTIPAGTNRVLLVSVFDDNAAGTDVDQVVLNDEPLTLLGQSFENGVRTSVYIAVLGSSETDSIGAFYVDWTDPVDGGYLTQFFQSVDQFAPVQDVEVGQLASHTVELDAADLAVSAYSVTGSSSAGAVSGDAHQVVNSVSLFGGEVSATFLSSKVADGATTTLSYSGFTGGETQAHVALSLNFTPPPNPNAPRVTTITRLTPTDARTDAISVTYRVTFNEDVSNVDSSDFSIEGDAAAGACISGFVAVSDAIYDVTVTVDPASNGRLRLRVKPGAVSGIQDVESLLFEGTV